MSRVNQTLALIDDPTLPPLDPGHPADAVLQHLLVDLAYSDGVVQGDEFALLQRVRPDLDPSELMSWAMETAETPFRDASLARLAAEGEDPMDLLRFAARMVCLDGDVADEEIKRLARISAALKLDPAAPQRAIDEIVATGGAVKPARVLDALRNMLWRVVRPRRGDPERPELVAAAPAGAEAVCTLEVEGTEHAALYTDGLLALFADGARFVTFAQIAKYTRVPVPGAGFHLHEADGTHHEMADARMAELGALLDFLYAAGSPR